MLKKHLAAMEAKTIICTSRKVVEQFKNQSAEIADKSVETAE